MLKTEFMFCLFVSFCSSLLDLVDAPGVFIMGCHAQHKRQIQKFVTEMDEVTTFYASFRSPTFFFFLFRFYFDCRLFLLLSPGGETFGTWYCLVLLESILLNST